MKYIKGLIIILSIILFAGCNNNSIYLKSYNNMQVDESGINGYKLDLRIYGLINHKAVNKIIKITDYSNAEYEIRIVDPSSVTKTEVDTSIIYIKNGKTYIKDETGKYVSSSKKMNYVNPNIYLEGLRNVKKETNAEEVTINGKTYNSYTVTIDKSVVGNILADTDLSDIAVKNDISAVVTLDKNGYVYRIVYHIDPITINANYYDVNAVKVIDLPDEIK